MDDPGSVRLRQTKHMPPNTGRPGKSKANSASLPRPFCRVKSTVLLTDKRGQQFSKTMVGR